MYHEAGQNMIERTPHPTHDEAYIFKRSGGKFWIMEFKNPNGKRTRKTTKTENKREALRILGENITLIKKINSGEITILESKLYTCSRAVAETIRHYQNKKPQKPTYKVYIRELKAFADRYGDLDISRVNRKILREYFSQHFSKSRLGMIRTALRTMFVLCEDSEYIKSIPDFPTNIETKKTNKREGLKKDQVQAIIHRFYTKSITDKFGECHRKASDVEKDNARIMATLMILLYHTGARIGELRHLKPSDISHRYDENGQFLASICIRESKTVPRIILIPINVWHHLKKQQMLYKIENDQCFFMNRSTGRISNDFNKIVTRDIENNREFYENLKVKDFCLYRLRHTFIIERLLEKKNIVFIAQHCGTSVKMIEDHYADYIATASYEFVYTNQTKLFNLDQNSSEEKIAY